MSRAHLTTALLVALPALVLTVMPALGAQVDSTDLAHCHAIAGRDERLSCYEALTEAALSAAVTPPGVSTGSDASTVRAAGVSGAPTAAAPPARPVEPNDPANFGLSRHQLEAHASVSGPASIKTSVAQITEDRQHNITVVLDNGQTWVFIEPEPRLRPGDTVTIKRASLGSFLMTTPSRRSYRVERVR
jgi:hypothetical protein